MKTNLVVAILSMLWVLVLSYLSGFDFNSRGTPAVMTAMWASVAGFLVYTCPFFKD